LPVTVAHRSLELVGVSAGIAPEDCPFLYRFLAGQNRQQIDAIERTLPERLDAGSFQNGRRPVHGEADLAGNLASRQLARPADDAGDANPTFPQRTLTLAARRIPRELLATIVVREHDQGILLQAVLLERSENLAHTLVKALDHLDI